MNGTDPSIYKKAFRETKNPAIITDSSFVIRDVNEACVDFTGYDRVELVGEKPEILFGQRSVYEEMTASLSNDDSWVGGFETTTKDGRLIYGQGSCTPIHVDGELHGYAGFFSDLTERRQYERSLRILNRVLRHNLRNDANVVLGHIEIVAEIVDDEELQQSLSTAHRRMHSIIKYAETARDLDELLSERTDPTLSPIRIDEVIRNELRAARNAYPGAEFTSDLGDEPTFVAADDAIGIALEAILSNAVEHNDSRVPRVFVRFHRGESTLTVEVEDNGPGIADDEHDLIFGREEVSPLHHGQGLDLFFVDRLMEKYGGDVWAENDDGATFSLQFRIVSPTDEDA
ncbi:PAS domain-containing sensor histidine kinase [Haladaptatus sp. AB643]|uniref:PAS domain-containing sensor histidine kinase n=1 Tax=Haladaptatus sp. AB643 TaxID=2934174 RepID=UPI00209C6B90|nr:PAS domain-containing sensor histidine kinase [Haladaptatus sp. AB643]MCO8243311.1 PAS domain-containing sensor histidine kinase [Haladaptatus sp. AB643]